jgi:hypothetical protein
MTLHKNSSKTTINSVSSTTTKPKVNATAIAGAAVWKQDKYVASIRYMADGEVKQPVALKDEPPPHTKELAELLTWRRPSKTPLQDAFIEGYLMPRLEELQLRTKRSCEIVVDDYGNVTVDLAHDTRGAAPSSTMFTAHIDTVHSPLNKAQYQTVCYDHTKKTLFKDDGECLGADDGTGIYILLQMIKAEVPGLYVFFKDEELGRLGSTAFLSSAHLQAVEKEETMLSGIQRVVSFDRMNATDVITRQRGRKCASDEFAKALGEQLKAHAKLDYKPSPNGSFTDSATFMDVIPECTNISIGYKNQHSGSETQNMLTLNALLSALPHVKWDELPSVRDPSAVEPAAKDTWDMWGMDDDYSAFSKSYALETQADKWFDKLEGYLMPDPDVEELAAFIADHPYVVAQAIIEEGYELFELKDLITRMFE